MIEFRDASGFSVEQFAAHLTNCFEDYVIPAHFTTPLVAFLLRVEAVDLLNTLVAVEGGAVAGILMVTRRERQMRVGAMAVAKAHRGVGLGHQLMERVLAAGRDRGESHVVLEAIEHNLRAIAFYESCGFKTRFRLISGELSLPAGAGSRPSPAPFSRLAMQLVARGDGAWSWDMSPGSVMQYALPIVGYEQDGLCVAVQPVGEDVLICRAMALSGDRDLEKLREMLAGLGCIYPGRVLKIPPYFPEPEYGNLLLAAGMEIGTLSQVQMERDL